MRNKKSFASWFSIAWIGLFAQPPPQEMPRLMVRAVLSTCEDLGPQDQLTNLVVQHFAGEIQRRFHLDPVNRPEEILAAYTSVLKRRREAGESTHPFHWAAFVAAGDWR